MKLTIKLNELLTLLNNRVPHSGIVFTDVEIDRSVPVATQQRVAVEIDYALPIVAALHNAVGPWMRRAVGVRMLWPDKIGAIKSLRFVTAYRPSTFKSAGQAMKPRGRQVGR